jgi:hypothetical protein
MALLGIALADSITGLNPLVILPSIVRILGHYFLAWMLGVMLMAVQVGGTWLAEYVPIPFITTFCVEFLTLYLLAVTARVLGIMYYVHRTELDWLR